MELTYEKYLANLSEKLNQIHGVNYTERYWRIIIGIWLRAIDALYDRYLSICQASDTSMLQIPGFATLNQEYKTITHHLLMMSTTITYIAESLNF